MSHQQVRVTFQPTGRSVYVLPGTKMLEAAARAGLAVQTPCGGAGSCGKCRVQVHRGASAPAPAEQQQFGEDDLAAGWRLACQTPIRKPCTVSVPASSLFASRQQILTEAPMAGEAEVLPGVRKLHVELSEPSLADAASDLERLERVSGQFKADLATLRRLPRLLRKTGYKGTAVLADHHLIDFEEGDTTASCYGVAFDIGTTTLVAVLLDLRTGDELAVSSRMNPQMSFGDDVVSRIQYASQSRANLEELRRAIVQAASEMIDDLARQASISAERIYEIALAGNTTMEHLLCGLDVEQLGQVPFTPAHSRGLLLPAAELGLPIHPRGAAYVLPVISGFVGGDAVAGMLATRLTDNEAPTLMIDIGTNGEIMLANGGSIWAASTAAGPAFEGARISCGMRATDGAIEKIVFGNGDLDLSVIANALPVGICGSALVDLGAGLLEAGIVSPEGRLLPPGDLPPNLPEPLRRRVIGGADSGGEFVIAERRETRVSLTQRDVRELQLATGAIRAGVNILLRAAGLSAGDLGKVLIAGGFGSFIRRNHAQRIGLLPAAVDHKRIHYVGNTSLSGAKWALLSTRARKQAEQIARLAKHVQLSDDPDFQTEFAEAMIFPGG